MRNKIRRKNSRIHPPLWQSLLKLFFIACLIFSIWEGWQFTKPSHFPINHVKIIATFEHVDQDQAQAIIDPYLHNGFFYINAFGLQRQLLKLPWVYTAAIDRVWPDTVSINITEQQTIAQWGSSALINMKGKVFSPPIATFPKNLPLLFGPDEEEQQIFQYYLAAQQLFMPLNLEVTQLILNPHGYWQIALNSGTTIFLREDDPLAQLQLLLKIYPKIIIGHDQPPKSVDLRYNNGLAVQWN